jgi:hypothetical protein
MPSHRQKYRQKGMQTAGIHAAGRQAARSDRNPNFNIEDDKIFHSVLDKGTS